MIANQGVVDSSTTVPTPTDADGVPGNGAQPALVTVGGAPSAPRMVRLSSASV